MSQSSPDRLERIEAMLERLVNIQANQQDSITNLAQSQAQSSLFQNKLDQRMEKLIEAQLAGEVLRGQLAEQTLQLKRAVDYLLSKDGNPMH